jgi:hypothetical protein
MSAGARTTYAVIGLVVAAATAGAVLAVTGTQTPARLPLVLLFLLVVPALAVATLLTGIDALGKAVIAGSAAIVTDLVIAEAMIASGTWSPRLGVALVALVSLVIAGSRLLLARWARR